MGLTARDHAEIGWRERRWPFSPRQFPGAPITAPVHRARRGDDTVAGLSDLGPTHAVAARWPEPGRIAEQREL